MLEPIYRILDFIFPVYIINRDQVLSIEDRRPTRNMFLSIVGLLVVIVFATWGWFSHTLIIDGLTLTLFGAALGAALYFCLRGTFRELYVFDKTTDTYTFIRQSVLRKDIVQGAASLYQSVEVLCVEEQKDSWTVYHYHAALLQDPSMLFGADEVQKLRESKPMYNCEQTEINIASAISRFLNIRNNGTVETVYRALL